MTTSFIRNRSNIQFITDLVQCTIMENETQETVTAQAIRATASITYALADLIRAHTSNGGQVSEEALHSLQQMTDNVANIAAYLFKTIDLIREP